MLNDITTSPISKCNSCITCNRGFLDTNPVYFNQWTGERDVWTEKMSCRSTNIIYLIKCSHPGCSMQYIGQSINSVNTQCIQHRSGIRTGNEPTFVREHFIKIHSSSNLRITPLMTVVNNSPVKSKKSRVKLLKSNEDTLVLSLNTLYPYGLNDRLERPVYKYGF